MPRLLALAAGTEVEDSAVSEFGLVSLAWVVFAVSVADVGVAALRADARLFHVSLVSVLAAGAVLLDDATRDRR